MHPIAIAVIAAAVSNPSSVQYKQYPIRAAPTQAGTNTSDTTTSSTTQ